MLPVTDQAAAPIEEPDSYHRTPAGETILVVEDQNALREVTERIFTRNGYHVLTAANGPNALALAAATTATSTYWSPTSSCPGC